ncbi:MAG: galactokinase [candidate division KSB1 bacterium]|nr:galactokinase [candidate division KSB1 bacterium]
MASSIAREPLLEQFTLHFGAPPQVLVRAAGRVNLIGEHTDYNDGFVLPAAIDRHIYFLARRRAGAKVRAYAAEFDELATFPVQQERPDKPHHWSVYLIGVLQLLQARGVALDGFDVLIAGNLPRAAGLSSSAALEVGMASLVQALYPFRMQELELIKLVQQAEHQFAGTKCGIMDMFVCRLGRRDHALFLDCRSLDYRLVPLQLRESALVICDSKKKRGLASSAYNERRAQCEEGVRLIRQWLPEVRALRDVSVEQFAELSGRLPEVVRRRCEHVVRENARVLDAVRALEGGDLSHFGRLMVQSHESLRDLYEVSCPELDTLVESALAVDGTLGARLTGAGFGGCTVNLVRTDAVEAFRERVCSDYVRRFGREPGILVCRADDGVQVEWL